MKKIILFTGLLFCSLAQAQAVINVTGNGRTITEGQTFTFNTLDEATATLTLIATNVSNAPVNVKIRVDEVVNNNDNGNGVALCFGQQCFNDIQVDDTVPARTTGLTLQPNQSNTAEDHFWNSNNGNGTDPVRYKLSFVSVNSAGAITGTLLSFYYVYDADAVMALSDFTALQNIGISLGNTVVKNQMDINASQKAKMEVFNISGQLVKSVAIQSGIQAINMSDLSTSTYIVRFTNEQKQVSQIRILKN